MIKFNEVTWYSKLASVIFLLIILPYLIFLIGVRYEELNIIKKASIDQSVKNAQQEVERSSASSDRSLEGDVGVITQNQDGTSQYVSNKYKFSFVFPSSWRIGDNDIGDGTFQIMNYSEPEAGSSRFGQGQNKIEMMIVSHPSTFYSDHKDIIKTEIAGQEAFNSQDGFPYYVIKIPSQTGKYLDVTIYGDTANYKELESVIKTIKFF